MDGANSQNQNGGVLHTLVRVIKKKKLCIYLFSFVFSFADLLWINNVFEL